MRVKGRRIAVIAIAQERHPRADRQTAACWPSLDFSITFVHNSDMALITKKQRAVLDFISAEIEEKGFAPSYQEIAGHLGLRSVSTIHKHVEGLRKLGLIDRGDNAKRQYELKQSAPAGSFSIPLLGEIAAGAPIENFSAPETLDLPAMLGGKGALYALRVRGDSMIDEGIHDGDTVLIEPRAEARNGEIVVALLGGREATLKTFRRVDEGRAVELIPANPALKPVRHPAAKVQVQGILRAVIRLCH